MTQLRQKALRLFAAILALCLFLPACGKRTTVNLSELETRVVETAAGEEPSQVTIPPTEETTVPETTVEATQEPTVAPETTEAAQQSQERDYILNTNSKKIHNPGCSSVQKMKESNKKPFTGTLEALETQGYVPCKMCKPT